LIPKKEKGLVAGVSSKRALGILKKKGVGDCLDTQENPPAHQAFLPAILFLDFAENQM
jgi:hypothetical protein